MDYYKIKRCSNSELSIIKRELLGVEEIKTSPATLYFGQKFHQALLEPKEYTTEGLSEKEVTQIAAMIKTARKSNLLQFLLNDKRAEMEKPVFWNFEGVEFKAKLDVRIPGFIGDPKTTSATSLDQFMDTFSTYGYWRQAALYMNATGDKRFSFFGFPKNGINQVFIVNAHDYQKEIQNGLDEAKFLTEHYKLKNGKQ